MADVSCTQRPFEQHPVSLTWRTRCSCGFIGHWRGSPDRATDDYAEHADGNDREGHFGEHREAEDGQ